MEHAPKQQHEKITGYRTLTPREIDLLNEGKALAEAVGNYIEKLRFQVDAGTDVQGRPHLREMEIVDDVYVDQRWVSLGATSLQQGFMALARAVAKPTTF